MGTKFIKRSLRFRSSLWSVDNFSFSEILDKEIKHLEIHVGRNEYVEDLNQEKMYSTQLIKIRIEDL